MAGRMWSDKEARELIRIWAANLDLLDGTSRNNKVYESMAAQLRSLGHLRTGVQVKEKLKRLRKGYRYGKRNKIIAPYHEELATVLAQGSKGDALFIRSKMDASVGSEESAGTDSEANNMDNGPGCSAPPAKGNGNDDRVEFCGSNQGPHYSRLPDSPPIDNATVLRFLAGDFPFPTITTVTAEPPGDGAQFPAASAAGDPWPPRKRKRELPDAPSPPTQDASALTDLITRGIDKLVELENTRMRHELDLFERLRREEFERQERSRREQMEHELRIMNALASLFKKDSSSSVNINSSSSEPPAGS